MALTMYVIATLDEISACYKHRGKIQPALTHLFTVIPVITPHRLLKHIHQW